MDGGGGGGVNIFGGGPPNSEGGSYARTAGCVTGGGGIVAAAVGCWYICVGGFETSAKSFKKSSSTAGAFVAEMLSTPLLSTRSA